jgi:hypothetical protein
MLPFLVLASAISASGPSGQVRVGVAPVSASGDTAAHIDEKIRGQVESSLSDKAVDHVVLEAGWAGDCEAGPCLQDAMADKELDYLFAVQVEVVERDFETKLVVYAADGSQVNEVDASCEIRNPDEAATAVGEAAASASDGLEAPEPEGPEPEPVSEPVPVADVDSQARLRQVGIGLTAAGAVGLISGVTMIAVEEKPYGPKCDDSNTDSQGECEFRNKTVEGGTVLTVLGGLAAGAGVTMLVLNRKGGKNLALAPFGRGIKIRGSF